MSTNHSSFAPVKQGVSLSEYAPDEKPWDKHRGQAQTMEKMLVSCEDERIQALRDRIVQCSPWLIFAHTTPDERGRVFKLHEATFCRVRTCPVCQWRRSLRHVARFMEAWPSIVAEHPDHRWIHLTLTVRNVAVTELRDEIRNLNAAWKRLMHLKAFKTSVLGYLRNVEVTRSATGEAHPHMHVLLMVSKQYFKRKQLYITRREWQRMWGEAARLDYSPEVWVQAVSEKDTENAVREILKYATKPEDLLADTEWLIQYIYQVHNLRFLSAGGVVKKHLSTEEPDENEMIVPGQEDEVDDSDVLAVTRFDWNRKKAGYYSSGTKVRTPENDPKPEPEPWESWTDGLIDPVRRGDWEAEKREEAAARMKEILDEMREEKEKAPPLEAVLGATGNSWARKKSEERKAEAWFLERWRMNDASYAGREKRYQEALKLLSNVADNGNIGIDNDS